MEWNFGAQTLAFFAWRMDIPWQGQKPSKRFMVKRTRNIFYFFLKKHLRLSDLFGEETNEKGPKQRNLRPTERKLLPESERNSSQLFIHFLQ